MIFSNEKVDRLMIAMAQHEGWFPMGHPQHKNGSASYRRHNPGNLRSSTYAKYTDNGFAVFETDFLGWFAFYWDLYWKATGRTKTGLSGQSTIHDLIYKWAPPSDNNDTEAYVQQVEKLSGMPATTTLAEIFETK